MCEQYITSNYIEKLGHKIQEIRERALFSITSKLDNGFLFDNNLARSRELLTKLFHWFLFEPCTREEHVLNLIKRILQGEAGKILIKQCGSATIIEELSKIRSYIDPQFIKLLDEIIAVVQELKSSVELSVPPLQCDIPLSYRSTSSNLSPVVGSTATTIKGFIDKSSSLAPQFGPDKTISRADTNHFDNETTIDAELGNNVKMQAKTYFVILQWQPLIETDRNILQSVENSLSKPADLSTLYHSCEFFINVLLHDFPAEIFLQRPGVISILYDLLQTSQSSRLSGIILVCLHNLTRGLQKRISYSNDSCMRNLKAEILPSLLDMNNGNSNRSSEKSFKTGVESELFESPDDANLMQNNQITIPFFCFQTLNVVLKVLTRKRPSLKESKLCLREAGINTALITLNEVITLLCQAVSDNLWNYKPNSECLKIFKELNNSLSLYGDVLDFFRIESVSLENSSKFRVIYLLLLSACARLLQEFIPLPKSQIILPKNFKLSITNSLLDVSLGRLFPKVHKCLLEYVESFTSVEDKESLKKYKDVIKVCDGLTATVNFDRNADGLTFLECLHLAEKALPSLQFHKSEQYIDKYIDLCSNKLYGYCSNYNVVELAQDIMVRLLAHCDSDIQKKVYKLCHKKILDYIGTRINLKPRNEIGTQIYFILSSKLFTEIAVFGLQNNNVKEYAEEILLYILKCKVIVSENVWSKCLEALIPSLPLILCYAENHTSFGRIILNLVDPDTARNMGLPDIIMFKSNIYFLFSKDPYLRDEAFSRICWLMASQENSREILPKFNTLYDRAFANACTVRQLLDINKIRRSESYYQPSSLHQVLDLLKSPNVEPVIRRSALNQISVMMEDHLLHDVFLESNGINLILDIMNNCLREKDFRDYPDSIIPIISILKSISLYHSSVRERLGTNIDVLYCTLRGIFLFFTDNRVRQDASVLLFLLLAKDFITGSPSRADFAIPALFSQHLIVPFASHFNNKQSRNVMEDLYSSIMQDRWSLSSIQVQWNVELYGDFNNLINESPVSHNPLNHEPILQLKKVDLLQIKSSSIHISIKNLLFSVQNATIHGAVLDSVSHLTLYLNLYKSSNQFNEANNHERLLTHPWEKTFSKFLETLPSTEEDIELLRSVIKLLVLLVPFYKNRGKCWISDIIKNPSHCLLDLLDYDYTTDEETKILTQELLQLITLCVIKEQHYLDYTSGSKIQKNTTWGHMVKKISDNLLFNNTQHFYNLAYLDALLTCLVRLTASLGWTNSSPDSVPNQPVPQMISNLCELLIAFHCGKGPTAAVSVMGLSISRNVLLILNHILSEFWNSKVKKWENLFFDDIVQMNFTRSILALSASRDVILRAAALQLFSGLASSPKAAQDIINDFKYDNGNIWELAFTVLIDHTEAGIVRENAALLLTNLIKSLSTTLDSKPSVLLSVSSNNIQKQSFTSDLLSLLDEYDFYNHLEIILTSLFTLNYVYEVDSRDPTSFKYSVSDKTSTSSIKTSEYQINITTPGFIRAVCLFLYNLVELAPKEICSTLHERGSIKLIFKALCNPSISINNSRELALYCNILEMNSNVCSFLRKMCSLSPTCIGTVLYTRDCLTAMLALLNSSIYQSKLSELLYLRNQLWSEIYNLLTMLLEKLNDENMPINPKSIETLHIITEAIVSVGIEEFLDSLCESLSCIRTVLQSSALQLLIAMLRIESYCVFQKHPPSNEHSFKTILDTVRTPRSALMSACKDNIENMEPSCKPQKLSKKSLQTFNKFKNDALEDIYFNKIIQLPKTDNLEDIEVSFIENETLLAGAEITKIILYLYDIASIKLSNNQQHQTKKTVILAALSSLMCVSNEAKVYALKKRFMEVVVKELRNSHIQLSLESVESMRRIQDKKRICPILKNIDDLIGLLTNFILNNAKGKLAAVDLNLADIIHKLWIWFMMQNSSIVNSLQLMAVYTFECSEACRSLPLTSAVAGSGPRKTPSNVSLLHAIIVIITKEMEQISRSHDLTTIILAFDVLKNCSDLLECRILISKSNLFQVVNKLHPTVTKRQVPWDNVEFLWLDFLHTYTKYPEGQAVVAKCTDVLELVMSLTSSVKINNRELAVAVLKNLAFYQPNRPRLLSSGDFLNILQAKLMTGTLKEKKTTVLIIWALAANNQKAKLVFKSAKLDMKLENIIKHVELLGTNENSFQFEDLELIQRVLNVLRGTDRLR